MYEKEKLFLKKMIVASYNKCINKAAISVKNKGTQENYDFVTSCDLAVDKFLTAAIRRRWPDDHIVSEEANHECVTKGRSWIIDPIDGTNNFMKGLPLWCIQVAFMVDSETKLAIIYVPCANELYFADESGATLNGNVLKIDDDNDLKSGLVSFGNIAYPTNNAYSISKDIIDTIKDKILRIRSFGAGGYELSAVASGKLLGYVNLFRYIWDIEPGIFICKQAGANIMCKKKGEHSLYMVSANKELTAEFKKIIKNAKL